MACVLLYTVDAEIARVEIAGLEIAGVEIAAPDCGGGNHGSANRGRKKYGKRRFKKCVSTILTENRVMTLVCLAHRVEIDSNVTAAQRWAE